MVKNVHINFIVLQTGLDGVVNNAGIVIFGLIEWFTMDELQKVMDVNFWGTVRTVKEMLPLLKVAKGRIVNFSSITGKSHSNIFRWLYVFSDMIGVF